jgi:hypothetical protein
MVIIGNYIDAHRSWNIVALKLTNLKELKAMGLIGSYEIVSGLAKKNNSCLKFILFCSIVLPNLSWLGFNWLNFQRFIKE